MNRLIRRGTPTSSILAVLLAVWATNVGSPAYAQDATCDAPELLDDVQYNSLVCRGVAELENGAFQNAVSTLREADRVVLPEYPNFKVLPRLAFAYVQLGDTAQARATLEKARRAFEVYLGFVDCRYRDGRFRLQNAWGPLEESAATREVVERMCGEAYEYVYEQTDLQNLEKDLPLLDLYYAVRDSLGRGSSSAGR